MVTHCKISVIVYFFPPYSYFNPITQPTQFKKKNSTISLIKNINSKEN